MIQETKLKGLWRMREQTVDRIRQAVFVVAKLDCSLAGQVGISEQDLKDLKEWARKNAKADTNF